MKATAGTALLSLPPSFTRSQAQDHGLARWELYALRDAGRLLELSRGVFRRTDAEPTAELDLLAVSLRVPHGTICLVSALVLYDLTDEIPAAVDLAIPRPKHVPQIVYPPTRVHVFDAGSFAVGRERRAVTAEEHIYVYSAARTVVDVLRLRGQVGTEVAYGALRAWLGRRGAQPAELLDIARQLRAERPVAAALEILA